MRLKVLFHFGVLLICSVSGAQELNRFSQFNFIKGLYNPGALATDAPLQADLVFRDQWAGVEGSPSTFGFNGAYELRSDMAVGLHFYNDRIGLLQTNSISASYAYRLLLDERKYFAFGLGLGANNLTNDLTSAKTITVDPAFAQNYSYWKFNGSFGVYYRSSRFYAGLSLPQLLSNSITANGLGFKPQQLTYILISGYYLELGEKFYLNPNLQIKAQQNTPIQGDFLLRMVYDSYALSLGYRSENSLIAGLDVTFGDRIRVGYAFNYDVGSLARIKGASHEVHLGLGLPYYFSRESLDGRRYVGRKGNYKSEYRLQYRRKRKH